jgi:hypothetical protein
MIARSLRELGRQAEAATAYAHAATTAQARVARGEAKYAPTADAAQKEGAALDAHVGTLRIHIAQPAGVARPPTLTVDKKSVPVSKEGDAIVLRDPGTVSVAVTDGNGAEQRQTVTVLPGAAVQMEFNSQVPPARAEKTETPPESPHRAGAPDAASWARPAALATGGLTAVGLGVFIGFGLRSQSTFDDLSARCGAAGCGPADRPEADDGKQAQTVANVGLAIAAVSAVATIVFLYVALTSSASSGGRASRLFDVTRPGPL